MNRSISSADGTVVADADAARHGHQTRWLRFVMFGAFSAAAGILAVTLADTLILIVRGDFEVVDFRPYYLAAEALRHGQSLYPSVDLATLASGREYVYPPLTAILVAPFSFLPIEWAAAVWVIALVVAVPATLYVAGVRDWRCYPVAFLWVPTLNAVGLGQVTILLGLGAALTWRLRDRDLPAALVVGVALTLKLILWPLVVWLAATRRHSAAILAVLATGGAFIASWLAVGFVGFGDYLDILRRIQALSEDDAYSVFVVASEAGAPEWASRLLQLGLAAAVLAGCVVLGRRGNERGAFVLAITTALLASPIVWRHYFELLLVAVAVARPTLGIVWFVPIAMWFVSTGSGNGAPRDTAATLAFAALTVVLAVGATLRESPFATLRLRRTATQ